ncbi:helix-turn-helix domain-containing protein [Adhaeribacter radiodurans]|uniref:Helix-turn-helix transcriptional regulator n=1 Tax=Adhaeribacter radiodurans TaxID=2745197 RepID=A0A7L7L710_9BACT|nr:AraC family transcriptional regulator [Adhaeribacter radiodurans]QMU28588.1 helix-turn-helix transcriptional regulator [Adhaeribacter radiodurans]
MNNEIYVVPDYLTGSKKSETHIHFYSANKSSVKNKVVYNQFLICFMLQGTKEVLSQNKKVKINNQEILLLEAGSVLMTESLIANQKFESILLFFSEKFVTDFCLKYQKTLKNIHSQEEAYPVIPKDNFLNNFQNSLLLLQNNGLEEMKGLKLEELLLYLHNHNPREFFSFLSSTSSSSPESIIRKVMALHGNSKLTIEELAFLCNMSAATFKRHFAVAFQTSPKKYLTENRMQKARQLLQHKKAPSKIYLELGYESLSSFSNEFKKYVGVSPKKFQNRIELKDKVVEPIA